MAKTDSVTDVLADLAKKHSIRIGPASEAIEPVEWITTGCLGIDYACGHGLPLGRSVELYGQPSSGKTTTALQAAAELQRDIIDSGRDEHILYLDFEHALDRSYCAALGLDTDHPTFLAAQPHSMEQGAEAALQLISTGKIRLSIWDSVAAMAPLSRLEGDFDQRTAAMNKARLMAGLMLQLTPLLHKNNSTAVFINHLMESVDMNARPGMPARVTTPGGKALKFYASLRLEYRQMGSVKTKGTDVLTGEIANQSAATLVKVKCVKNKVANPFREVEVRITHGRGFDNVWSGLQVLLAHKIVRKTGAWYKFGDLTHPDMSAGTLQGESAVLRFADEHPDWATQVIARAVALVASHGGQALETGDLTGDNLDVDLDALEIA